MSQNEPMSEQNRRKCLQHYRDLLGRAGFMVFGEQEIPNGHAPFPHMSPWAFFLLAKGHVIRMGYLVSCIHLDYSRTTYRGDLYPERPNKTGGASCLEVDEKEMLVALERLFGHLYPSSKK